MSENSSNDDAELDKLLTELERPNTSEEDKTKKDYKKIKANDEYNVYETNTIESPDEEW